MCLQKVAKWFENNESWRNENAIGDLLQRDSTVIDAQASRSLISVSASQQLHVYLYYSKVSHCWEQNIQVESCFAEGRQRGKKRPPVRRWEPCKKQCCEWTRRMCVYSKKTKHWKKTWRKWWRNRRLQKPGIVSMILYDLL